jgi:hypothetical protein
MSATGILEFALLERGSCPRGWCRKGFPERVATVDLLVGFGCELEPGEEDDDR